MRRPKWPTPMGNTIARLHFDIVERQTPATPAIGRAAKIARPADGQFPVRTPDVAPRIELLGCRIGSHRTAFEQRYAEWRIDEFARKRYSGCTAADDAQIAFYQGPGGYDTRVDQH